MIENIKPLIALLTLLFLFSAWVKKNNAFFPPNLLARFFSITTFLYLFAFLIPNYWIFILITFIFLKSQNQLKEIEKICLFFFLLPLLPLLTKEIPGFSGIRFIADITYPRALTLSLLLPIYLTSNSKSPPLLRLPSAKILIFYLTLLFILGTRENTLTNSMRTLLYLFIDIFIPYFTISRSIKNTEDLQKVLFSIFYSMLFICIIAIFETLKGWHLFYSLAHSLNIGHSLGSYGTRESLLRATAIFSSPISLGYATVIGLGSGIAISSQIKNKRFLFYLFFILSLALLATLSRGPWVGAFCLITIYGITGKNKSMFIGRAIQALIILSPILFFTSVGDKFLGLLPFIQDSSSSAHSAGSVSYRQELFTNAVIVIKRNLMFGSINYIETPEMQSMMQGQGIIDIVNSYLRIALSHGVIGLLLFCSFFINLIFRLYSKLSKPALSPYNKQLGRALLATLISILIIIATVSSIDTISLWYWSFAAIISSFLTIKPTKESS